MIALISHQILTKMQQITCLRGTFLKNIHETAFLTENQLLNPLDRLIIYNKIVGLA